MCNKWENALNVWYGLVTEDDIRQWFLVPGMRAQDVVPSEVIAEMVDFFNNNYEWDELLSKLIINFNREHNPALREYFAAVDPFYDDEVHLQEDIDYLQAFLRREKGLFSDDEDENEEVDDDE